MDQRRWTREYFGVSHLEDTPRNIVATVTRHESGSELTVSDMDSLNPFSGGHREWFPGKNGFEQARAQAEVLAKVAR